MISGEYKRIITFVRTHGEVSFLPTAFVITGWTVWVYGKGWGLGSISSFSFCIVESNF